MIVQTRSIHRRAGAAAGFVSAVRSMLVRFYLLGGLLGGLLGAQVAGAAEGPFDHVRYRDLALGEKVVIGDVDLGGGVRVDLAMERFDVLGPEARLLAVGRDGVTPMPRPDLVLLRGRVAGDEGSRAFVGIAPDAVHGFIDHDGKLQAISSGPHSRAGDFAVRLTEASAVPQEPIDHPFCGTDIGDDTMFPFGRPPADGPVPTGAAVLAVRVAIDSDWEYTRDLFNGDAFAGLTYAITLLAGVSEIYREDLNAGLYTEFIRMWTDDLDPYDPDSPVDLLQQFKAEWNMNLGGIERDTAHLLSGRTNLPYGGVAYLGVLCANGSGYGLSGYLNGSFPYPLQDNVGGNWDLVVVAHELGHNFGTVHTHNFNPPIDGCGLGDCSNASEGTIMSYCHTCAGGISNIELGFHPQVIGTILNYLDDLSCDLTTTGANAVKDDAVALEGQAVTIDMLLNDAGASCDALALDTFDAESNRGGTVTLVPAGPEWPRDRLRYMPPAQDIVSDYFFYTLVGGSSGIVSVRVTALRDADLVGVTQPGVPVAYYELDNPLLLPDFDQLTAYDDEVVPMVNYVSTGGLFAGSGRSNEVGAVYQGLVTAPASGLYTFSVESDDGSALYIGDERVVLNDGLHGMVEVGGTIGLEAGVHEIRVDFFENQGGAGLIVRYEGPDVPYQTIPASAWSHEIPCGADLDGSGEVGLTDLVAILAAWGPCAPCAEDLDGDGAVGLTDLITVLSTWGPCE